MFLVINKFLIRAVPRCAVERCDYTTFFYASCNIEMFVENNIFAIDLIVVKENKNWRPQQLYVPCLKSKIFCVLTNIFNCFHENDRSLFLSHHFILKFLTYTCSNLYAYLGTEHWKTITLMLLLSITIKA